MLPSPWWLLQESATLLGVSKSTIGTVISCLWPIALIIVAQLIYKRISSDQPGEVVAPFALAFAWILVAPWVFAWYAALAWVALTQVPRNRMTRWLTIVTVVLALWHSSGGQAPSHVMAAHVRHPCRGGPGQLLDPARPRPPPPADQSADRPAPPRRWPFLRWHWLAAVLLTAGLVLRVLAELAYRPALFYIDTPRYLFNADGMDPVGYKGPLRAILAVANFQTVTAVQHLLGLAMAVVIYVLLLRRGVNRWLAALAMAPVLLDGYQLQSEQSIMPGTWFEALIVAGLAVLLWRPGTGWRRLLAAGVLLGASATVAQVGEALLLPAVLYRAGGRRRLAARIAKAAAVIAGPSRVPIVAYMAGSQALRRPSPCRTPASPRSTAGWPPPPTARRSSCPPPSAACARPRPSRPRARTGWSTTRAPRCARTTTAPTAPPPTPSCRTSTTRC